MEIRRLVAACWCCFCMADTGASTVQDQQMLLVTELLHESLYDALAAERMTWYDG